MITHISRIALFAMLLILFGSLTVSGQPKGGFGGFNVPDPGDINDIGDITDIVDDITSLDYIINNLPGFGLGTDQEDPITTSFDDAVYDAPFLDDYPHAPIMGDLWNMPLGNIPMGTGGGNYVMPGRYEYNIQGFCLHAGTYGPGHGSGYIWAPIQGPWANILTDLLKTSESHPEIPQYDVQALIWAILARTSLIDMNPDMQRVARTLLSGDHQATINGGAFGVIPQDLMGEVFDYVDVPPMVEQAMRSQANIRSMLTAEAFDYADLEGVAVLAGNPPPGGDDRDITAGRWSLHPNGYFVRYEPHGYASIDLETVVPDKCTVEFDDSGNVVLIEDEHGNRLDIQDSSVAFTCLDPDDYHTMLAQTFSGLNIASVENSSWAGDHRAEVERLCGNGPGYEETCSMGIFAHALSLATSEGSSSDMAANALDLAQEAWMNTVITINMTKIPEDLVAWNKEIPDYDWRTNWDETNDSDGTATPAERMRQRLAGRRDPRPSQDSEHGQGPDRMQDYDPNKNPPAHSAREGMNGFNDVSNTLGWIESGPGNIANTLGLAIPNAMVDGILEFNFVLWDYCTGAIASDPPRPDYDVIATPIQFSFTPAVGSADYPQARADALNTFMSEGTILTGFLTAAVTSIDRQGGATQDGDQHWAYEQAKAALYFERQAGYQMYDVAIALDAYIAVLRAEGITDIYTTPETCRDRQDRLRNDGLSPEQQAAIAELGMNQSIVDTYIDYRLSLDPNSIACSAFDSAAQLSSSLRECGCWLINLPDVREQDFNYPGALSVSP